MVSVSFQVVREFVGSVVMADLSASNERPSGVNEDVEMEMEYVSREMMKIEKVLMSIEMK